MMTDFSKILEKAKELETKMRESQEKIKQIELIGTAGGDAVKITLNGESEIVKIDLTDEILKEEKGIIEDLITAAHNNAKSNKEKTSEEISKATGGFGSQVLNGIFKLMQNISEIETLIKLISKL